MAVAEPGSGAKGTDVNELAKFGYKQELDRSLGSFSSFAAGFSYISILTGVFQLFAFGFAFGGPAVWWTWPIVFIGQFAVALCFAEMAGQFPLAGSVYQWSKRLGSDFSSWMTGWIMIIGSIVTVAAVAVAWQVILPQISTKFQFAGSAADAGLYNTPGGAKNAIILAAVLVLFTTVVNMLGVKIMARINNAGVFIELVGCTVLVVLLLVNVVRGPGIVFHNFGLGAGHSWGYLGAFLIGGIMSAYVMYGFDTAGTLAEETNEPRKHAPPAILRALASAGLLGGLLILFAMMAAPNIHDKNVGLLGMPFIVKGVLGNTTGNVFLWCSVIAITVCCLAVQTAAIRMMFAMARDGRLPFGSAVARVSGRGKVPIIPALVTGIATYALLAANIANQQVFTTLTSVAIIMFYLCYLGVTLPMFIARRRGTWPRPDHGPYFSMGRWGLLVNGFAVVYGILAVINIGWPRVEVYSNTHWYFQYGAIVFIGLVAIIGSIYYFAVQKKKTGGGPLAEHRADLDLAEPPIAEVAP
jgi:urea carboxylase system permease